MASSTPQRRKGFTLIEVLLGALVLVIAVAAILGSYLGQLTLTEHARNLAMAINDANRVVEAIRQLNSPCAGSSPTVVPTGFASWDAWLNNAGRSMITPGQPASNPFSERIVTTCRKADNSDYCAQSQVGMQEWNYPSIPVATSQQDPMLVTVAVCWRHRGRTLGQCNWDPATSAWDTAPQKWDSITYPGGSDTQYVLDSPAMLTTLVTCRAS